MSEHKISLEWKRATPDFQYQTYNRDHTWKFDGGHEMEASAAPAYLQEPENSSTRRKRMWRHFPVVTC